MNTQHAINTAKSDDAHGAQSILNMITEAARGDILPEDAVIIPPLEWGDGTVIWINDGYNTMVSVASGGEWQTFEMATWAWVEHALHTITAAGYTIPDIEEIFDLCRVEIDYYGLDRRTMHPGGPGRPLTPLERAQILAGVDVD